MRRRYLAGLQRIEALKKAAGEIKLTEYTEEESQAAKARLAENRAKRRKRYTNTNIINTELRQF
jgi:hypothetical protein